MARKRARVKSPPRSEAARVVAPPEPKPAFSRAPHPAVGAGGWQGADWLVLAVMLVLGGLHLWLRVQPGLRYQVGVPAFFVDAPFFGKFAGVSGGLLQYAAAAVAQLNFYNAPGAAALTMAWAGILLCARLIFQQVSTRGATAGALVLMALLAAMPGRYQGDVEAAVLGILAGLAAACAWLALPPRFDALRLFALGLAAVGLLYVAGTFPTLLFTSTVAVIELAARQRPAFALGCILPALVVPVWAWLRPNFEPLAATRHWGGRSAWALFAAAYAFVPVWLGLQAGFKAVRTRLAQGRAEATVLRTPWLVWALEFGVGCALVGTTLDPSQRAIARLDRLAARHEWDQALAAAKQVRTWTAGARLNLTRALYNAGRLPEDLFSFPQTRGSDLLPGYDAGLEMSRALSRTLFELGEVNLAEHMAHEALEMEGARPDTLRLLARINVLKERPGAARVFLNRLRLAPFHRVEAEQALQALAVDPRGANDGALSLIRTRLPTTDLATGRLPTEMLLQQLLAANRTNGMAYAYLLAHRLLNAELEPLVQDLAPLASFGYTALPRPCEEAVLLHQYQAGQDKAEWHGFAIRPAIVENYRRFADASQRYRENPEAGRVALASEFGDTFWYYLVFGRSARPTVFTPGTP